MQKGAMINASVLISSQNSSFGRPGTDYLRIMGNSATLVLISERSLEPTLQFNLPMTVGSHVSVDGSISIVVLSAF
jgi:hypothetical protein